MWEFDTIGFGEEESVRFGDMTWLVLDTTTDGNRKLLLAEQSYCLSWLPGDSFEREAQNGDFTWEASFARGYLNGQFVEEHFSQEERARICEVLIENKGNPFGDEYDCPATSDKVFMLSLNEAVRYFASNSKAERLCLLENQAFYTRTPLNRKWAVSPIRFAMEDEGLSISVEHEDVVNEIYPDMGFLSFGFLDAWTDVSEDTIDVRPALWIQS